MRAAVFSRPGEPLRVEQVEDPRPEPSELVLKVTACGVCGSDLHFSEVHDSRGGIRPLPAGTVMGHEFAGEVVEVGSALRSTSGWRVGQRACALPYIGCGRCAACLAGDMMHCAAMEGTGLGQVPGAYAEYVRVGSQETLRLPESVDFRSGALTEPLAVGLHAVDEAEMRPGQNVLVVGAGPIGLAVTAWAASLGTRAIVVSEPAPGRRELAARIGATAVLDGGEDVAAAFADHAGGPPDVVFECVGVPGMLMRCIELARNRGRVVVAGVCMEPDTLLPLAAILKEVQLRFVLGYRKSDFQLALDMLASERIRAREMVTDVVDLAGLPDAFEALRSPGRQCKVLIEP